MLRTTGEEAGDHCVGVLLNPRQAAWNTDLRVVCVDALLRDRQAAWNIIYRCAGLYVCAGVGVVFRDSQPGCSECRQYASCVGVVFRDRQPGCSEYRQYASCLCGCCVYGLVGMQTCGLFVWVLCLKTARLLGI